MADHKEVIILNKICHYYIVHIIIYSVVLLLNYYYNLVFKNNIKLTKIMEKSIYYLKH